MISYLEDLDMISILGGPDDDTLYGEGDDGNTGIWMINGNDGLEYRWHHLTVFRP